MENCKLCGKPADRTGSHFLPHFLLKRIDNVDGSTERDKELGFVIGEKDTKSYIGRGVLPEQFEGVFGELSEEEAKAMKNPAVEDHVFCNGCETKFAKIEGEYAKTLESFDTKAAYVNKIPKEYAFLFWVSILWRVSVSEKYGLILKGEEEELFRVFLNTHLKENVKEINTEQIKNDQYLLHTAYRLIRSPQYSQPTYLLCHPENKSPYTIVIDEYAFLFYFNSTEIDQPDQTFFGFENFLYKASPNTLQTGESILPIYECEFHKCMENLTQKLAEVRLKYYNWVFDEVHKKMGGKGDSMPAELKSSILKGIMSDEKKLGRKYTFEDLTKTMFTEMKKYSA